MSHSTPKPESSRSVRAVGLCPDSSLPRRINYPFAAVAGHRAEKHALLLLAVDPQLRGVLIATAADSSASILASAFPSLLPSEPDRELLSVGDQLDTVHLPINVTDDDLLGGLDLEQTLASGRRQSAPGLLARANGYVLYIDDVNLIEPNTATHVARALDRRQVAVEREGVSAIHDADFVLLGTFSPAEGEPNVLLRDRVALIVNAGADTSADERVEMIDRDFRFHHDPSSFAAGFEYETAQIKIAIEAARAQAPRIRVSKKQVRQLAMAAIRLGVEGNRADVFALKAARANAALAGRDAVTEDDLVVGIQLVLAPRATKLPSSKKDIQSDDVEPSVPEPADDEITTPENDLEPEPLPRSIEDLIIHAIDSRVPDDALTLPLRILGSARNGKRFKATTSTRGRYVHSTQRRTGESRVAIDATLRAAAPFQLLRRATNNQPAKSEDAPVVPPRRVRIQPGDLRFKTFKHRSGILFILAVDSSGSMAFNRMAQAKGALARLLRQAYLHRDQVALISFRGTRAEVLLTPTRSVELARRSLDSLPAGGGTPVSAAVVKALELARRARVKGMPQAMLVMFTDGRANVGLLSEDPARGPSAIAEELKRLGSLLRSEGITSVVVDTKSKFVSSGEAGGLALMLGARYVYLPRSDAATIYNAIASAVEIERL